jgi:hypothetical protein
MPPDHDGDELSLEAVDRKAAEIGPALRRTVQRALFDLLVMMKVFTPDRAPITPKPQQLEQTPQVEQQSEQPTQQSEPLQQSERQSEQQTQESNERVDDTAALPRMRELLQDGSARTEHGAAVQAIREGLSKGYGKPKAQTERLVRKYRKWQARGFPEKPEQQA